MASLYNVVFGRLNQPAADQPGQKWTVVKDVNGDGRDDLLNFGAVYPDRPIGSAPLRVYLQDADGNFTVSNPMADGSDFLTTHPRYFEFKDFNGDGIEDIFVAAHGYDAAPFPGEQNRLLLGVGGGKYQDGTAALPKLVDFSHALAAGDIDRDGDQDLFVGNLFGQTIVKPYLLVNDGKGGFTQDRSKLPTLVVEGIEKGNRFSTADLADLDGDGFLDLILGGAQGPSRVFWGSASGFTDAAMSVLPASGTLKIMHDIVRYDFNRDGRPDLLMLGITGVFESGGIQLLINDGQRGFVDRTSSYFSGTTATVGEIYEIRMLDLNGDGHVDLARSDTVFAKNASDPVFWINNGSNQFRAVTVGELGLPAEALIQDVYVGPAGEIRLMSAAGVHEGKGFVNYLVPTALLDPYLDGIAASAGPRMPQTSTIPSAVVHGFFNGTLPDAARLEALAVFSESQFQAYAKSGVARPALGPYEALGRGFGETAIFDAKYGKLTVSEFVGAAYQDVFERPANASQSSHFAGQVGYFQSLYLGAGIEATKATMLAKGAAIGQMLGFAALDEAGKHPYLDALVNGLPNTAKSVGLTGSADLGWPELV